MRSDAVAIGGDAEQSLSADAAFLAEAEAGDGVRKGRCCCCCLFGLFVGEKRGNEMS